MSELENEEFTPPVVEVDAPGDANALRGHHFKRLMGMQRTWWLIGVPAVVIGGFLVATSVVTFLSCMNADRSAAAYVALERVRGTLGGKTGTFVLQHSAKSKGSAQSLRVDVVAGSGTGDLAGLEGEFDIVIDGAGHHYVFRYRFVD